MHTIDHIAKSFEPKEREHNIYQAWLDQDAFTAHPDKDKKPYTIVMPPPNITGQLHMGHALDVTLQDLLIRFKRMQGYAALWLPGTDHAAIATEAKIVEAMSKEGVTKDDLGRDGFMERAWAWKDEYGNRITEQIRRMGSSCDWSRERFTMDEGLSEAVVQVFVNLYKEGYIYRGERMINWCPNCLTSISDVEVEHEDTPGHFWHLIYPLADGSGSVELATTRPETMLGDTAVAVHPEDDRYRDIVGKTVILPLTGREIPIIADEYVDREFGTGVVKITPAHDPNDFEVGLRHNLPVINIMNDDATLNENAGEFAGLSREEARAKIVQLLDDGGFLVKTEDITHAVGSCSRCHSQVEPRVSLQWFVAMKELAEPALEAVRNGDIRFVPDRFSKLYFHWMENIRDWCISRQLWWGHRIPAWYCDDCGEITVAADTPEKCEHCGSSHIHQDPDTLDTWFSSALWPFSTLGWPEKTEDLAYFYPTDVLVTGYDIITFWVSRMIFSALHHTGKIPFRDVLIHGLVRDSQGRKMSKSLGNGIDPLEIIDHYGADSLRYALVHGTSPGNDMRFTDNKVEAGRNFINKIWNAFRFSLMNRPEELDRAAYINPDFANMDLLLEDRWILTSLNRLVVEVTQNMEDYEFGIAIGKIYSFLWEEFCDWYIEMVKSRLRQTDSETAHVANIVLNHVLVQTMRLLHPFMPFFTEDIYAELIHDDQMLITGPWPELENLFYDEAAGVKMATLQEAIRAIRNLRAEMNVPHKRMAKLLVYSDDDAFKTLFTESATYLEQLAFVSNVEVCANREDIPETAVAVALQNGSLFIPMEDLVDIAEEKKRLAKEVERLEREIQIVDKKLANKSFVEKAPEAVVNKEREKKEGYLKQLEQTKAGLAQLG